MVWIVSEYMLKAMRYVSHRLTQAFVAGAIFPFHCERATSIAPINED